MLHLTPGQSGRLECLAADENLARGCLRGDTRRQIDFLADGCEVRQTFLGAHRAKKGDALMDADADRNGFVSHGF